MLVVTGFLLSDCILWYGSVLLQYLAVRLFRSAVVPGWGRWWRRCFDHGTSLCRTLGLCWCLVDEAHLKVHGTVQSHLEAGFLEKAIGGTGSSGAKVILVHSHRQLLSDLLAVIPLCLKSGKNVQIRAIWIHLHNQWLNTCLLLHP